MDADVFLARYPVFTRDEWMSEQGSSESVRTKETQLHYYVKTGRAVRVRQGLYVSVPPGIDSVDMQPDPFLICAKTALDSVVAYHGAMEFHGRAYSMHQRFEFLTVSDVRRFQFRGVDYRPVAFPKQLIKSGNAYVEVQMHDRAGLPIRVTSLERTLVDVLDRPDLAGGWEEIWRSMGSVEYFDGRRIIEYLKRIGNMTTVAKVGYFLEQHEKTIMFGEDTLDYLTSMRPKQIRRMETRQRTDDRYVARWNLVVPVYVDGQRWEEPQ